MTDSFNSLKIKSLESFSSSNEEDFVLDALDKLDVEEEISSGIDEDEFDAKLSGIQTINFEKDWIKISHQESPLILKPKMGQQQITKPNNQKNKEKEKGKEKTKKENHKSEKENSEKGVVKKPRLLSKKNDFGILNKNMKHYKDTTQNYDQNKKKKDKKSTNTLPITKKDQKLIDSFLIVEEVLEIKPKKKIKQNNERQKGENTKNKNNENKNNENKNKKENNNKENLKKVNSNKEENQETKEKEQNGKSQKSFVSKDTTTLFSQNKINFYQDSEQDLRCDPLRIRYLINERIIVISNNVVYCYEIPNETKIYQIKGKLILTNYRIFFVPKKPDVFQYVNVLSNPIIPLGAISRVSKFNNQSFGNGYYTTGITIYCKNFRVLHFYYPDKDPMKTVFEILLRKAFPLSVKLCFAYKHKKKNKIVDNGWYIYHPNIEFQRQGLPNGKWALSKINAKYNLCSTYPQFLVFPKGISNKEIVLVSKYRSKGRLPTLTWIHPSNGASLVRCSQPKVGITKRTSSVDQKMMKAILKSCPNSTKLFIQDCRPKKNAMANKAKGGGYEIIDDYPKCNLTFLGIDNIHVMRESLNKIKNTCIQSLRSEKKWLSSLENSGWFTHMQKIIRSSTKISKLMNNESQPILVHCSDGWDRTAQICSLVQLFLDSYFRTIEGFEVLIEKDWLSFGHKFHQRIGQANSDYTNSQRSPVFLQWIDCVFQCVNQFPTAFEFNEDFLIFILENLFSLRFGTFLFNNDQERKIKKLSTNTYSLWTYVNQNRKQFMNPYYQKKIIPIYPEYKIRNLIFWDNYYMKYFLPSELEKRKSFKKKDFSINIQFENLQYLSKEETKLTNQLKKLEKKLKKLKKIEQNSKRKLKLK
ncbi:myotubularin-related [Anaeramoeba flamelloides]|uniref:phosphatidylinositol-3,5-bisphosphate 3-phosphatase n=1 Tax=Anaeramoeba flamelloides TaxID=1746091 RepID=A0AAV7Z3X8_9EUKA|nr:myotubularin-related [Anaeramoeba flamelloides]